MKTDTATMTSKGQLVIPAPLRRQLGIRTGTKVHVQVEGTGLFLQPVTREFIRSLRGIMKGRPSLHDELLRERRRDLKREELRFRRQRAD